MRANKILPGDEDPDKWKFFWASTQPKEWFAKWGYWRSEPQISFERQEFLLDLLKLPPDIKAGKFSFSNIALSRADVEWLLAYHISNRQLTYSSTTISFEINSRLDLRGADLRGVDLSFLPLSMIRGGLNKEEWDNATVDQRNAARLLLQGSNLSSAHLEKAILGGAHLESATIFDAFFAGSFLGSVHFEGSLLQRANFIGAELRGVYFSKSTNLSNIVLASTNTDSLILSGIRWGNVDVSTLDWGQLQMLQSEFIARNKLDNEKRRKDRKSRLKEYKKNVRDYRQLAILLRQQGLNEDADRFSYRALICQRRVSRYNQKYGQYFWSCFLDALAGFGYKPQRSFAAYLFVIFGFAITYFLVSANIQTPLSILGSIVFSLTSFHGRGFFPVNSISIDNPLVIISAIEAFVGLIIEICFIATFTQRYFGK